MEILDFINTTMDDLKARRSTLINHLRKLDWTNATLDYNGISNSSMPRFMLTLPISSIRETASEEDVQYFENLILTSNDIEMQSDFGWRMNIYHDKDIRLYLKDETAFEFFE